MKRILIVDGDPDIRESLPGGLSDIGAEIATAADGEEALAKVGLEPPDIVLTDVRMPGLDGLELLRLLRKRAPSVDVILMTAFDDMPTVVAGMREGARDFLVKPLDLHDLRRVIGEAFEDRRTRERARRTTEDQASGYRLDELVGHDPRMIGIYKLVGQLAANRANVLIRGETGTGKEVIARAIHFNSPDVAEPFIPVNCTAFAPTLLESELFGHVRGAFTGAVAEHRGRFALAGQGTIFLDEVGDTSTQFQSKLLRVLEDHEFYLVGGEKPERTEARVVAATHRDLEKMIPEGSFREDLYYRLRVVEITVPPLRERMRDVPLLAEHLVRRAAQTLHRDPPVLSSASSDALLKHPWPGNVRELENCLTRAVVVSTGNVIRPEHLAIGPVPPESPARLAPLGEVEREHVARVLAATGGHKTRTAEILQISRPRLARLMEKYGME
ncbi:MAG: sigma-54 dependent transcriptional regulator [Gemmatimonadota bacterium]